jgi:hypothetical protein
MKYVYVLFIRDDSEEEPKNQRRGFIAGKPSDKFPVYHDPFIVCKVDPSIITNDMLVDDTICLKLDKLQTQNTTKPVENENGEVVDVVVYDYFDKNGRSSEECCPVITLDDVDWEGKV